MYDFQDWHRFTPVFTWYINLVC